MPCNSIVLNKIEISAANAEILAKALVELHGQGTLAGISFDARYAKAVAEEIVRVGFVRLPAGKEHLADLIKQEYSRQAVQAAARKLNWRLTQKSPAKILATRRA